MTFVSIGDQSISLDLIFGIEKAGDGKTRILVDGRLKKTGIVVNIPFNEVKEIISQAVARESSKRSVLDVLLASHQTLRV